MAVLGKLKLDTRLKLFSERTVRHWNKLPREVAPSPLLIRKCLDDSQIAGLTVRLPRVELGIGLDNPHGSLPAQDIVCFY